MPTDAGAADDEEQWVWNTRITAEAARIAMAKGKTPSERFEIYEKMIAAAIASRQSGKTSSPSKLIYDNFESSDLSGFVQKPDTV